MSKWHIIFDDNGEGLAVSEIAALEGLCTSLGFNAAISTGQPSVSEVLEQVVSALEAEGEHGWMESFASNRTPIMFKARVLELVRSFMPPAQGEGTPGER
jgi:hypothetical protein